MPKLSLNMEAIEERFDRIRREKAATRMAEIERKQVGLTRRTRLSEAGATERRETIEAGLGERLGVEEVGKEKRLGLKEVASKERIQMQVGKESPAYISATAAESRAGTAGEALSMEKRKVARIEQEEDYKAKARGLLQKLGLGEMVEGEFHPTGVAQGVFFTHLAGAGEDPEAFEKFEAEINIFEAKKAKRLEFDKMTPEQKDARRAEIATLKKMEQEEMVKQLGPLSLVAMREATIEPLAKGTSRPRMRGVSKRIKPRRSMSPEAKRKRLSEFRPKRAKAGKSEVRGIADLKEYKEELDAYLASKEAERTRKKHLRRIKKAVDVDKRNVEDFDRYGQVRIY